MNNATVLVIYLIWGTIMLLTLLFYKFWKKGFLRSIYFWRIYSAISFICGIYWMGVPTNKIAFSIFISGGLSASIISILRRNSVEPSRLG